MIYKKTSVFMHLGSGDDYSGHLGAGLRGNGHRAPKPGTGHRAPFCHCGKDAHGPPATGDRVGCFGCHPSV